jgi:hypothetical protein
LDAAVSEEPVSAGREVIQEDVESVDAAASEEPAPEKDIIEENVKNIYKHR